MSATQAAWLSLILAAGLANLPFLRLVLPRRRHPAWHDVAGWAACYALWMGSTVLLESASGKITPKDWEVWAVSLALFAVLAFPGIVWRHLLRK
jgi:hypothetical protein